MQTNPILFKHELVEVLIPVGSTQSKFYLPDLPNLRNVHLWGIETFNAGDVPKSIISGLGLVPFALFQSLFLTLQTYNGKNFAYQIPFLKMHTLVGATITEFNAFKYAGQKVNYPKSYIEIADTSLISGVATQSILLSVTYSDIAQIEAEDRKANFRNQS